MIKIMAGYCLCLVCWSGINKSYTVKLFILFIYLSIYLSIHLFIDCFHFKGSLYPDANINDTDQNVHPIMTFLLVDIPAVFSNYVHLQ